MNKFEEQLKALIKKTLGPDVGVFLFGSRARKDHLEFSDIDIGIYDNTPIKREILQKLKDAVDESNIPFKVDIIDFSNVKDEFKKIATQEIEIWQNPSKIQNLIKSI